MRSEEGLDSGREEVKDPEHMVLKESSIWTLK